MDRQLYLRRQAGKTPSLAAEPAAAALPPAGPLSLALLPWGSARMMVPIGFRNRLAVLLDWLWAYVTFQRGARLITGP